MGCRRVSSVLVTERRGRRPACGGRSSAVSVGRGHSRSLALAGGVLAGGGSVLPNLGFGWEPRRCRLSEGAQRGVARQPGVLTVAPPPSWPHPEAPLQ